MMYFSLIDRIVALQPGERIMAEKVVSPREPYFHDHFPGFPVMPGVLMLEAMYQTSAWLLLQSKDFACGVARLRQARNVKYGSFVKPGDVLTITAHVEKQDDTTTNLRAKGTVREQPAVSACLLLEHIRSPRDSRKAASSQPELRAVFDRLYTPTVS